VAVAGKLEVVVLVMVVWVLAREEEGGEEGEAAVEEERAVMGMGVCCKCQRCQIFQIKAVRWNHRRGIVAVAAREP